MIRLLIVDDHRLFRFGLRKMLQDAKGIQIIGEAGDGEAALRLTRELRPNVILMDLLMPGIGGQGSAFESFSGLSCPTVNSLFAND